MKKAAEAPHLPMPIVSDELWALVKARQEQTACPHGPNAMPFWAQQRPKYLFIGKIGAEYADRTMARSAGFVRVVTQTPTTARPAAATISRYASAKSKSRFWQS